MLTSNTPLYIHSKESDYDLVPIKDIVKRFTYEKGEDIKIMSFDGKCIVNENIASTRSSDARDFMCIRYTESKTLIVTPTQKIYDPKLRKYIRATDISSENHVLTTQLDAIRVIEKHTINNIQLQSVYTVSTPETACYFASGVLIYNYS